jgi:hypothetical protein
MEAEKKVGISNFAIKGVVAVSLRVDVDVGSPSTQT